MPKERTGFFCPKTQQTPNTGVPTQRPSGPGLASAGFTLLELVVVLMIAGTVMGIAVPKVSTALEVRSVRGASAEFRALHSLAKATAMRHGRTAQLAIDPYSRTIRVEVDTTLSGAGATDTVQVATLKDVAVYSDRSLLCFDERGLATSEGACDPGDAVVAFQWSPEGCYECAGIADTLRTSVLGKVLR